MTSTALALLVLGLCLSPVVPLVYSWMRSAGPIDKRNRTALYIATFSFIWLIAGINIPISLGRDYTGVRFTIISANLFVMLVCGAAVCLRKSKLRVPLSIACFMLAVVWFYVGAVNSAV